MEVIIKNIQHEIIYKNLTEKYTSFFYYLTLYNNILIILF